MARIIDRFDKYLNTNDISDNRVTIDLSLSIGLLGKSRKVGRDLSKKTVGKILKFYTDINRVWLLTGEGEMLAAQSETHNSDKIEGDYYKLKEENLILKEELSRYKRIVDTLTTTTTTRINKQTGTD